MKNLIPNKRWLTTALLTVLIIVGPTSCYLLETCPDVLPHFSIQGIEIRNMSLINPYPESDRARAVRDQELIKADSFFMRVEFEKTYHANRVYKSGTNLYAYSCPDEGHAGTLTGLDTVYLVTLQDYNKRYVQNDTLNRILMISNRGPGYYSLSYYLTENKDVIYSQEFRMKLNEKPAYDGEFSFKLIYVLKNGERFENTSEKVRLVR